MTLDEIELPVTGTKTGASDPLRQADPGFCAATEDLFGRCLAPQWMNATRFAAVNLALDALVTQLDPERLRTSIGIALEVLDCAQILTVLEIVSVAGLHSVSMAAPVLLEEYVASTGSQIPLSPAAEAVRTSFEENGAPTPTARRDVRLDPCARCRLLRSVPRLARPPVELRHP